MNTIYIITGVSGSGKTTLSEAVFKKGQKLVTTTSRAKRTGEKEAVDYYFVDKTTFSHLITQNALVEYDEFVNGFYGLTKEELRMKVEAQDVYILLNHNGAVKYKELFPESVTIFIDVDKDEAISHMKKRGDSIENIQKRMREFEMEATTKHGADYIITNRTGQFEESVKVFKSIVNQHASHQQKKNR